MTLSAISPRRRRMDRLARLALAGCAALTVGVLALLLGTLVWKGAPSLDWQFLSGYPSRFPHRAGVLPALIGTALLGLVSMAFALPVGIAAAVYLHEFARDNAMTTFLRASIANLAGVPSVVFGILGLALFVRAMALGRSVLAAGLTLALLTLPLVIVVAEEALKTVPGTMRDAARALGASRWQVVRHHVLPYALPGILTGSILALGRSVGETAPLILVGAAVYIGFLPGGLGDSFTALPIQAYYWAQEARSGFHDLAWAAVLLLLVLVCAGNLLAILLRDRFQRKYRW